MNSANSCHSSWDSSTSAAPRPWNAAISRVRGDVIEIGLTYSKHALRLEFYGDTLERIRTTDPLTGNTVREHDEAFVYPAKFFVTPQARVESALTSIRAELDSRYHELLDNKKIVEAERLKMRTEYDLEMLGEMGHCSGIENYSRYLSGRGKGERPGVLLDFFPHDYLAFVDESHVTIPQVGGMYEGDRAGNFPLWSTASGCPRPWTTGRSFSMNLKNCSEQRFS